jgi:hypothetical protein
MDLHPYNTIFHDTTRHDNGKKNLPIVNNNIFCQIQIIDIVPPFLIIIFFGDVGFFKYSHKHTIYP